MKIWPNQKQRRNEAVIKRLLLNEHPNDIAKRFKISHGRVNGIAAHYMTKEEEIHKAMHYTNLQPLWASENQRKNAKIPLPISG